MRDTREDKTQPARLVGGTVGERINAALRVAGISQAELARRIGKRPEQITKWIKGAKEPDPGSLRLLAGALAVTVDELIGVVEGQDPPFDAWHAFLESDVGRTMTPAERRTLQAIPWAPGEEPTVAAYTMMLAGARLTQPRR